MRFLAHPARRVGGEARVPGDKSISHRALMLGALADGRSTVTGFLESEDCLATMAAMKAMGAAIEREPDGRLAIAGVGLAGLEPPAAPLDLGNSGTALRLLAGILAGQRFASELTGDESLRSRPMERIAAPLRAMGARIETDDGRAPLRIEGAPLKGIDYTLPMASAQVKSALLLAGLWAEGRTTVRSPGPSRDHTERMLLGMGVALEEDEDRQVVSLRGPAERLRAIDLEVPGDFSSAAFFLVAGCLGAAEGLLIRNVGVNPTRIGLLTALDAMGARIELRHPRRAGAEPVADLYVEQSELNGVDVSPEWVSLAIDELPILFIAAAAARGRTRVRGAEELRHKESDRLAVMAEGLSALGIGVQEQPDGLIISGGQMSGGRIDSHGDHRIAMAFAVASLAARGVIEISNTAQVATSFPGFAAAANAVGLHVESLSGDG
jgi:3-phosphoshikimate 1-carboxyvinyltransferase